MSERPTADYVAVDLDAVGARLDDFRDRAFSEEQPIVDDLDALIAEVERLRKQLADLNRYAQRAVRGL
jgi:hypothetical protein